MSKYTLFYYYTLGGQRLADYDYIKAKNITEAKKIAEDKYDEVFFIAKGHLEDLQFEY